MNKEINYEKYLSIITNFGCHYKCPYCIVKENNLQIPKTTLEGLSCLEDQILSNDIDIVSISGGGDPLYEYENNIEWYEKFFEIIKRCSIKKTGNYIPIEMHTNYMTNETSFPFSDCYRVVYHTNTIEQLNQIKRTKNEKVRVVYVVTENFTVHDIKEIASYVFNSKDIDELSFRQLVDNNYKTKNYLSSYLKLGHKKLWHYIEQNDYNLYYCENKISYKYEDFKQKEETNI